MERDLIVATSQTIRFFYMVCQITRHLVSQWSLLKLTLRFINFLPISNVIPLAVFDACPSKNYLYLFISLRVILNESDTLYFLSYMMRSLNKQQSAT